ncbi:P-loop containing nucleoside triphosphate hydrolase protein [Haematococcus lacustris]
MSGDAVEPVAAPEAEDAAPADSSLPILTPIAVADELAAQLAEAVQVAEAQVDTPDLALRLAEGLRERPEAAITTKVSEGNIYAAASSFEELKLAPDLLKGLYVEMKFEKPSRIQATTLPMILTPPYKDLIAQAHNGSGKTTCFVLSMLSRVDPYLQETQALCTCPTRELVLQNLSVLTRMAKQTTIRATSTASDDSGPSRRDRITEQVVIGTHGKLKNWASKRILNLDAIRILVFDEADEMLKADGFADDSVRLIRSIRKKNPAMQLLLFSATFNDNVKQFAMQIAPKANHVFVAKEELSLDVIAQYIVRCPDVSAKTRVLKEMIFPNCEKLGQTIIFVRTREAARQLHKAMEADGYKCTSITGEMEHSQRDATVQEFRDGVTKILIATDVLSRGFDVSQVTLVINYDVPVERDQRTPAYETYLHRIGRSGRFGRKGAAFNLVAGDKDATVMRFISTYFNKAIEELEWDDEDKFVAVLEKTLS